MGQHKQNIPKEQRDGGWAPESGKQRRARRVAHSLISTWRRTNPTWTMPEPIRDEAGDARYAEVVDRVNKVVGEGRLETSE